MGNGRNKKISLTALVLFALVSGIFALSDCSKKNNTRKEVMQPHKIELSEGIEKHFTELSTVVKKERSQLMKNLKLLVTCLFVAAVFMLIAQPVIATEPAASPQQESQKAVASPAKKAPGLEGQLNINTATAEQFVLLPGIGKTRADAIIQYRTENGAFKSIDDLTKVKGIGPKNLEKIKSYLVLEGETNLKKNK